MWIIVFMGLSAVLTAHSTIIVRQIAPIDDDPNDTTTPLFSAFEYSVSVFTWLKNEFRDMPADFGADIPLEGMTGLLVNGEPPDGCTNMTQPPLLDNFTKRWFVLIAKHSEACTYERQARNAQAAGFDLVIVHNVNSTELEVMTADVADGIDIPAVFVSDTAGFMLSESYVYDKGFYIMVNSELPFNINTHLLLPFAIIVVVCLLIILIFVIVKCIKDRRRARRHRLPSRALKKIPTCKFSKGDPYDTCAICLDDYRPGERLRVLPCAHAYHAVCIDPWLTQNKRVCPVCKRRVFAAGERRRLDSDSDSDDAEPLLADPPLATHHVTQGGTFDDQRENPFARATRFMARLRARATDADDAEVASSPSEDNDHMNTNNDENGNTEDTQPLVVAAVSAHSERRSRRARRSRSTPRARPSTHHSINTSASARGEIGVAALPATPTASNPRNINL